MGREGDAQPQTVHGVLSVLRTQTVSKLFYSRNLMQRTFCLHVVEFDVFMRTMASCLVVMVTAMCSYVVIEPYLCSV